MEAYRTSPQAGQGKTFFWGVSRRSSPLTFVMRGNFKTRNPRTEIRKKSQVRNPKESAADREPHLRTSDFGLISQPGLRLSDLTGVGRRGSANASRFVSIDVHSSFPSTRLRLGNQRLLPRQKLPSTGGDPCPSFAPPPAPPPEKLTTFPSKLTNPGEKLTTFDQKLTTFSKS